MCWPILPQTMLEVLGLAILEQWVDRYKSSNHCIHSGLEAQFGLIMFVFGRYGLEPDNLCSSKGRPSWWMVLCPLYEALDCSSYGLLSFKAQSRIFQLTISQERGMRSTKWLNKVVDYPFVCETWKSDSLRRDLKIQVPQARLEKESPSRDT